MRRGSGKSTGRGGPGLTWVRYAPRDWLLAVANVSAAAELAHRRLADTVWAVGEWPVSEPEILARLVRQDSTALPALLKELRTLGWRRTGSVLRNEAVEEVRREAERCLRARRAISRSGHQRRWGGAPADGMPPACQRHAASTADGMPAACTVQDGKQDSTVHALNSVERSTLSASPRKAKAGEAEFLQAVHDVLEAWRQGSATAELQNWGGWWRQAFRGNPRKARAVLNDVSAMARERRVTGSPGKAAVDLWKRLP